VTIFGFNQESLERHGVTEQECLQALADAMKIEVEESESADGNPRSMWVCKTQPGRLLEVGVEYMGGMDWVYHADNAQAQYRNKY
jgi:uncharacterized DUF497 family protein